MTPTYRAVCVGRSSVGRETWQSTRKFTLERDPMTVGKAAKCPSKLAAIGPDTSDLVTMSSCEVLKYNEPETRPVSKVTFVLGGGGV